MEQPEYVSQTKRATGPCPNESAIGGGLRAIEREDFPFECISTIAEQESWRKEVNRPLYHVHKWWAQRLGSVFRAILIGCFGGDDTDTFRDFYRPVRLNGAVVFDPFMGSGTTLGEALKLGARAIGRDINPVAEFAVRNALSQHSRKEVMEAYRRLERDVANEIKDLYKAKIRENELVDVLYYFWVMVVPCPSCTRDVDLFSSYVFARHAYPKRHPMARALCPKCGGVNEVRYDSSAVECCRCATEFDASNGPASGSRLQCPHCSHTCTVISALRLTGAPPRHRMYAKMILLPDGAKSYQSIDSFDLDLYNRACSLLDGLADLIPSEEIEPGYNTNQARNYGYTHWHQMFNGRQLAALVLLKRHILEIEDKRSRDLMLCLFSGTLEFNNMFASFKGEGTGAVRHMFSHHVLKPEKMALEANVWGTPKSSGAFSTLFQSRLLRALDYAEAPFEIRPSATGVSSEKVWGISLPVGAEIAATYDEFACGSRLYVSCGSSSATDIACRSVDAIVTDPPFFDNVHYSELADFFHVWQTSNAQTTRNADEVQHREASEFSARLRGVFEECKRVLKDEGILAFSYHHSRGEGWRAVLDALGTAGFAITACHPVKSELSVAAPKIAAKEPIDVDIIIVCRKATSLAQTAPMARETIEHFAREAAFAQVQRMNRGGRSLSRNDVLVIYASHVIRLLSCCDVGQRSECDSIMGRAGSVVETLHGDQAMKEIQRPVPLTLFDDDQVLEVVGQKDVSYAARPLLGSVQQPARHLPS